ncbi:MAG: hypothetical protein GVY14_07960 [Spirochaetes bacterium]|jgi:hypothetical protein|nr:hypothetical protein [Spirochaetota bacterium]
MKRDREIRPWTPRTIPGTGGGATGNSDPGPVDRGRWQNNPRPFSGVEQVRTVTWGGLPLGSVILDGPTVGGVLPEELARFPIIDRRLRAHLQNRYHFRQDRLITVATATDPESAERFAREVGSLDRRLRNAEPLAREVMQDYERFGVEGAAGPAFAQPALTESSRLVRDQYNSFVVNRARTEPAPSLLAGFWGAAAGAVDGSGRAGPAFAAHGPSADISLGNVVSNLLEGRLLFPADTPVTLHLALDVSYSMKTRGRIEHGITAANRIAKRIPAAMPNTRVRGYHFSDTVRHIALPRGRGAVEAQGTKQAQLFRAVLKRQEAGRHNCLVLITDGEPEDYAETLRTAEKLHDAGLDYAQVLLHTDSDLEHEVTSVVGEFRVRDNMIAEEVPDERINRLTEEQVKQNVETRFERFTHIAEAAGGNQVVLTEFSALGLITVELYDRYAGLLSLAER